MQTQSYSPFRTHPGNPRLSITRHRCRPHTITYCDQQYRRIADLLAESISGSRSPGEIIFGNRVLNFNIQGRYTQRTRYTGVEFLGSRESYIEETFVPESIELFGVYTLAGNRVPAEVNCRKILDILKEKELVLK